jgi:hypothetical protein
MSEEQPAMMLPYQPRLDLNIGLKWGTEMLYPHLLAVHGCNYDHNSRVYHRKTSNTRSKAMEGVPHRR